LLSRARDVLSHLRFDSWAVSSPFNLPVAGKGYF
jgi:hypothetical protein